MNSCGSKQIWVNLDIRGHIGRQGMTHPTLRDHDSSISGHLSGLFRHECRQYPRYSTQRELFRTRPAATAHGWTWGNRPCGATDSGMCAMRHLPFEDFGLVKIDRHHLCVWDFLK
jgi:hypothetical protein